MNVQVAARVDEEIRDKAAKVASHYGLTVTDLVRMAVTTAANEGRLPISFEDRVRVQNMRKSGIPDNLLSQIRSKRKPIRLQYDTKRKVSVVPKNAPSEFIEWVQNG